MEGSIDLNEILSLMGKGEDVPPGDWNRAKAAAQRKKEEAEEKKAMKLRQARLRLEEKMLKTFQREDEYRDKVTQGVYSANNKLIGQQMMAAVKNQQAKEKENTIMGVLRKKYAWQMLYFTAVAGLISGMVANSKLLAAFSDMIGSGLGFILDMLLTAIIPAVVWFMDLLFKIGSWFSGLPDLVKIGLLALGTLFAVFTGIQASLWLAGITAGITGIGTSAGIAAGATGVGALSLALGILGGITLAGLILNLKEVRDLMSGVSNAGAGLRESDIGSKIRGAAGYTSIGAAADAMNMLMPDYNFLTPAKEKELANKGIYNSQVMSDIRRQDPSASYSNGQYQTSVQVYIDGEAINTSLYKQRLRYTV